jgi:hypothetical protein
MSEPTTISRRPKLAIAAFLVFVAGTCLALANLPRESVSSKVKPSPEERALAYLGTEVPRWHAENHCYSCHNNGDGARALLLAMQKGYLVADSSLADTHAWLLQPENWDHNGGEGPFSDKVLARIQFARALADVSRSNVAAKREAAHSLAQDQQPDGSWKIEDGGTGSPCTYGNALATAQACQALELLAREAELPAIGRAVNWLANHERRCVLDDAAVLFGIDRGFLDLRKNAYENLLATQAGDGGWGLYAASITEPFDTALAMLALARQPLDARVSLAIERGRHYLIASQQPDGGWIETTRPPGAVSYAQRLSTTGWATLALLATRNRRVWR